MTTPHADKVHARFSDVERRIWFDLDGLSPIEPCGSGLWMYLLTSPRLGVLPGLIAAGEAIMADDLRWPLDGFRAAWGEIEARGGMVRVDWRARLVILPKVIKRAFERRRPESPNVIRGWRTQWYEVPECPLKREYLALLAAEVAKLGEGFRRAFEEAFEVDVPEPNPKPPPKPSAKASPEPQQKASAEPSPNQTQDQDQKAEPRRSQPDPSVAAPATRRASADPSGREGGSVDQGSGAPVDGLDAAAHEAIAAVSLADPELREMFGGQPRRAKALAARARERGMSRAALIAAVATFAARGTKVAIDGVTYLGVRDHEPKWPTFLDKWVKPEPAARAPPRRATAMQETPADGRFAAGETFES